MIFGRPVAVRIRCTASIVDSVPELLYRHIGRPNRRASSRATTTASSVGWAKWVPLRTRSETAATIAGCACPTMPTPKPPCMSTYSVPSTSRTREPWPRSIQTAAGGASCQLEATPPASTSAHSARTRCDSPVRARNTFSCSTMSRSRISRSVAAGVPDIGFTFS
jgi:hypothetical protein